MDLKDYKKYLKDKLSTRSYYNITDDSILDIGGIMGGGSIFDKLLEERIVFLGEIDDYNTEVIKANLLHLDYLNNDDITIYINSAGGSVYSGLGLLDVMEYIKSDVVTINTGLAASMAAIILCSGTKGKRKSLKRSRTMIHQPLTFGRWIQQASDVEIEAREINHLKSELYEIISEKTGQPYDKVSKDGDRDYWMGAKEALKYGMIDEIIKKKN